MMDIPILVSPKPPTFREAFRFWVKLGFISFGGPAAQIAVMRRILSRRSAGSAMVEDQATPFLVAALNEEGTVTPLVVPEGLFETRRGEQPTPSQIDSLRK